MKKLLRIKLYILHLQGAMKLSCEIRYKTSIDKVGKLSVSSFEAMKADGFLQYDSGGIEWDNILVSISGPIDSQR